MMEFFTAVIAVGAAELGDKTQFIALLLAARFPKQRLAIIIGVICSTLLMHGIASTLGFYLGDIFLGDWVSYLVGGLFIIMGLLMLLPEKEENDNEESKFTKYGPFLATFLLLSLSEIADKSQLVTMMLAAHYNTIVPVAAGAVVGMNLLLIPVVYFGAWITNRIPIRAIKITGCLVFVALGVIALSS